MPSQERSRALVSAVLEAAAQVLEDRGYEGATVARIAARAGVSVGSLYQYFGTKDAIFEALTDELLARVLDSVTPAIAAPGLSFEARVEQVFRSGIETLRPHPTVLRQLASAIGKAFQLRLDALRCEARRHALALITSHPKSASIGEPELAARVLVDASEGILLNLRRTDDPVALSREARRMVEGYCAAF